MQSAFAHSGATRSDGSDAVCSKATEHEAMRREDGSVSRKATWVKIPSAGHEEMSETNRARQLGRLPRD
jgi:hypothetical protein